MNKITGDWQNLQFRVVLTYPQRVYNHQKWDSKFSFTLTFTEGTSSILDYGNDLPVAIAKAAAVLKPEAVISGDYRDHLQAII